MLYCVVLIHLLSSMDFTPEQKNSLRVVIQEVVGGVATKDDLLEIRQDLKRSASKEDLKQFATKDDLLHVRQDLEKFATRDDLLHVRQDLKKFATKDDLLSIRQDLKGFAKKEDLKQFATKKDLNQFATKDDLKVFATKDELEHVEERLATATANSFQYVHERLDAHDKRFEAIDRRFDRLEDILSNWSPPSYIAEIMDRVGKIEKYLKFKPYHH